MFNYQTPEKKLFAFELFAFSTPGTKSGVFRYAQMNAIVTKYQIVFRHCAMMIIPKFFLLPWKTVDFTQSINYSNILER